MDLWKSVAGMVEVELTSAELNVAFLAINNQNISLFEVKQISDLTVHFLIYRRDYKRLENLTKKRSESIKICRRKGLYWTGKGLLSRPVLLAGLVLLLVFVLLLPTRILFVQVEGNDKVPKNRILEAAQRSGITFGASRREVRSEKVKNTLLAEVRELQWAGVNTLGCVAVISVRERTDLEQVTEQQGITNIVAVRDGVLLSCTATRGTLLCSVGQAVAEGQMLISGYTDCGICLQATQADGEIIAQTNRNLTVVMPIKYNVRVEETGSGKKISALFGKKRINLWKDSGIWDSSCGRMYKEYYITLPGGFQLPFGLAVEEFSFYKTEEAEYPRYHAETLLREFAEYYLLKHMVSGSILRSVQTVHEKDSVYRLEGNYVCTEMIGKVQREKIGE